MTSLLLFTLTLVAMCSATDQGMQAVKKSFENFKIKYDRRYKTPAEEEKRFRIFTENLRDAAYQQKMNPRAIFGVNQFSDLTQEEFKSTYLADFSELQKRRDANPVSPMFSAAEVDAASDGIDWRDYGAVTYVKNQKNCGGCWSFSSTGSIEAQWVIAGQQPLIALSEQNLLSCDTLDNGCHGGLMDNAWTWLVEAQNGTIATEDSYPFVSGSGYVPPCNLTGAEAGANITGHQDLPQDERQMASWMDNNGPISIGVDGTTFQKYNGGIISSCINQQLNHAVLAVGYNATSTPPYWIVKNSWGTIWGEEGYVYVQMYANECLIANAPSTSVVGNDNNWHVKKRPLKNQGM